MNDALRAVAKRGDEIYRASYKAEYEKSYSGKFVAIDVRGGKAFLADTPEDALLTARASIPDGNFHLVQVGSPGVFRVAYSRSAT
ncbi:MAG: hypothetical protein ACREAA_17045 [Candidatus Polarisedimenticolia bacterium]